MEFAQYLDISNLTVNGLIVLVGILVLTRRIIWHTDLRRVEKERDEWKVLALRLLGAAEKLTTQHEVIATNVLHHEDDSNATSP